MIQRCEAKLTRWRHLPWGGNRDVRPPKDRAVWVVIITGELIDPFGVRSPHLVVVIDPVDRLVRRRLAQGGRDWPTCWDGLPDEQPPPKENPDRLLSDKVRRFLEPPWRVEQRSRGLKA